MAEPVKLTTEEYAALLPGVPVRPYHGRLQRIVNLTALQSKTPPDFFFASGRPNRYNPRGVHCLYFSEDAETAGAERARYWEGQPGEHQPWVTYFAEVTLRSVLDLENEVVRAALRLQPADLHLPWRLASELTATQRLWGRRRPNRPFRRHPLPFGRRPGTASGGLEPGHFPRSCVGSGPARHFWPGR
jgi:hypothetical protein